MNKVFFTFSLLIIVAISAVDVYLNLIFPVTLRSEENPVGRFLLIEGGIPLLMAVKLFGTSMVAAFLVGFYNMNPKKAIIVSSILAVIQFCFLLYMLV